MAAGITEPTGHKIGTTTIGSSGTAGTGAGLGVALAAIIVYILRLNGIDLGPIEWAIAAVCAAALSFGSGLLGGKYSPTDQKPEPWSGTPTSTVTPPSDVLAIPDGTGEHRAGGV